MPSSDLPPRPWIYEDSAPRLDLTAMLGTRDTERLSAEYADLLRRARSTVPDDLDLNLGDFPLPESPLYDAEEVRRRVWNAINDARTMHLPLSGARLHLGKDVVDEVLKQVAVVKDAPGEITSCWGIPCTVEPDRPGLVELRWTIRA